MGKHILLVAMILILAFLCCGCSHDKKMVNHIEEKLEESKVIEKDATYVYDIKDLDKYCFDESGIIYVLDGKNNCIRNYNPEGNQTREYTITSDKTISSFCYIEGKIYYIIYDSLYQLDLETGESVFCYQFEGDYFSFGGMVALKDALFILRTHQFKEEQMEIRYDEQDEYSYEGEELVCFDPSTLELEYIEIPNMKLITKKSDQELLIYAYDEEGGFYFTSYEVGDKWSEKKQYTNMKLGYLYNIAYDSVMERIICSNEKGIFTTSELDFAKQSYIYEQNSGRINDNTLQYQDGFTYDIRQMDGFNKIVRLQNTALIKENPVLKAYTLNSSYQPNGFGYQIEYEELDETELATVLMAGDSDYDIAILDASHEISRNILDVGAYYSLNSFEGIEEFLNQCWDYVKDAALASDGSIWMLPIKVECPILIYNKNLSKDYAMDINALKTYIEDLF